MVKAFIDINDNTNRILNVIKAKLGLKDKSQAIEAMADEYEELLSEREIKPSYLKKLKNIEKERLVEIGTLKNFRKAYNMK